MVDCLCTKLDYIALIVPQKYKLSMHYHAKLASYTTQSILYRYIILLFLEAVKQYLCVTFQRLTPLIVLRFLKAVKQYSCITLYQPIALLQRKLGLRCWVLLCTGFLHVSISLITIIIIIIFKIYKFCIFYKIIKCALQTLQ